MAQGVFLATLSLLAVLLGGSGFRPGPALAADTITFSDQIVRIFQPHCQGCHRPGQVAPFSLISYQDAYPWRQQIANAVRERRMPPWKPVPGHGEFANVRRLADSAVALIGQWVASGAPEGDPRDLPRPRKFPSEWSIGRPALVLTPAAEYTVPGGTNDLYRCFTIPITAPPNFFISAIEIKPGNPRIVHHVTTYVDTSGRSAELDRGGAEPGYPCFGGPGFDAAGSLGAWAPGTDPIDLPSRVAWLLPSGAHVVMQVHYHNIGSTPEKDRTAIGLHYARPPFDRRAAGVRVLTQSFSIPAGAARHGVKASSQVTESLDAIAIHGHMHLLGREIKVTARYPDGSARGMLYIDDWDFNWQLLYPYKRPVPLPAGTVIEAECVYDNSGSNPRNPNSPPKVVGYGVETTDEMCEVNILATGDLRR